MPASIAAAVMVPVYRDVQGSLRLVLIVRTPGGPHGGQIAFPGGVREPGDRTLWHTALREAYEEIGLSPGSVEAICKLDFIDTLSTGFTIAPYLARIDRPDSWQLQTAEVAEILEPRVEDFLVPGIHRSRMMSLEGWSNPREIHFYQLGSHELWGATYRIVQPLLQRLTNDEWTF